MTVLRQLILSALVIPLSISTAVARDLTNPSELAHAVSDVFASNALIDGQPLAEFVRNTEKYELDCTYGLGSDCEVYNRSPLRQISVEDDLAERINAVFNEERIDNIFGLHTVIAFSLSDTTNIPLFVEINYYGAGRDIDSFIFKDRTNPPQWSSYYNVAFGSIISSIFQRDITRCDRWLNHSRSSVYIRNSTDIIALCKSLVEAATEGVERFSVNDDIRREYVSIARTIEESIGDLPSNDQQTLSASLQDLSGRMDTALGAGNDAQIRSIRDEAQALSEEVASSAEQRVADSESRTQLGAQVEDYQSRIDDALAELPDGLSALGDVAVQRADEVRAAIESGDFDQAGELLASGEPVLAALEQFANDAREKAAARQAEHADVVARLEQARTELLGLVTPGQDTEVLVLATKAAADADRALIGEPDISVLLQATLNAEQALEGVERRERYKGLVTSVLEGVDQRPVTSVLELTPTDRPEHTVVARLPKDEAELRAFLERLDEAELERTARAFLDAKGEADRRVEQAEQDAELLRARVAGARSSDVFDAYPAEYRTALEASMDQLGGSDISDAELVQAVASLSTGVQQFEDWSELNGERVRTERAVAAFDGLLNDGRTGGVSQACRAGVMAPIEVALQSQRLDLSDDQWATANQEADGYVARVCSCLVGDMPADYTKAPSDEYVEFVLEHMNADQDARAIEVARRDLIPGMADVFAMNVGMLVNSCVEQVDGEAGR